MEILDLYMRTELLKEDDWARLRDIRLEALRSDARAFLSTYERESRYDERKWRREYSRGDWTILVDKGYAIGLIGVTREPSTPRGACYLEYMWIRPEFRRAGVASDLVSAVLKRLAGEGMTTVWLWVLDGNEPATRLYRQIGFCFTGKKQPLPDDPTRNENLMELSLRLAPDYEAGEAR
jgi:RimJ/RimL family protein N-acetyltransferase